MMETTLSFFLVVSERDYTYRMFSLWILLLILASILILKPVFERKSYYFYNILLNRSPLDLIAWTYLSILCFLGLSELVFSQINKIILSVLQNSKIPIEPFIFFFPVLILLFLSFLEWKRSKFLREKLQGMHKKPFSIILGLTVIILIVVIVCEQGTRNYFQYSNLISIFSIIGIIGTIVGVIITYEQLKIAEDRIDSYEGLYEALDEILSDKEAKVFQFYGPTILPGHIAYNDIKKIQAYSKNLRDFLERIGEDKAIFIAPSDALYKTSYEPYLKKECQKIYYDKSMIEIKVKEVVKDQQKINLLAGFVYLTEPHQLRSFDTYFFSNGKTVIYAMPLHYSEVRAVETDENGNGNPREVIEPNLIGFKTSSRAFIKSFDQHFEKMVKKVQE